MAKGGYKNAEVNVWERQLHREYLWSSARPARRRSSHTISSTFKKKVAMNTYEYYTASQRIWDTWTDRDMNTWLVNNGVIKSDAEVKRENRAYLQCVITWCRIITVTLSLRWLLHGLTLRCVRGSSIKDTCAVKRDQLTKMYPQPWPRIYCLAQYQTPRLPPRKLPPFRWHLPVVVTILIVPTIFISKSRSELLQETRLKWVQTTTTAERMINRIKDILDENVLGPVEERVNWVWEVLVGSAKSSEEVVEGAQEVVEDNHQACVFALRWSYIQLSLWGSLLTRWDDTKVEKRTHTSQSYRTFYVI